MAIKIQSLSDAVADNGLKILVHGPAGAGKTVLGATAGVPTLIISAEAGLLSIKDAPSYIRATTVTSLQDIYDVYEYLAEDHVCDWVVLDSISEIAEVVLAYERTQTKDPRQAYGQLQDQMNALLRKFRDLPHYNVLMTCKQQRLSDDLAGTTMYMPAMPGAKLAQSIPYLFDEVFALRVEKDDEGKTYRVLQTNRDAQYEAKDRSGMLEMFERPSLKHIAQKIHGTPVVEEPAKKESKKKEKPEATHAEENQQGADE